MAECVKYKGTPVTIGTCENLWYVSYEKFKAAFDAGWLSYLPGNDIPSGYLKLEQGYMFRFPFPDEDKLSFGHIKEDFNRSIDITITNTVLDRLAGSTHDEGFYRIGIEMQKPVLRKHDEKFCLALIYTDKLTGGRFRVESDKEIKMIIKDLLRHHVISETNTEKANFYREIGRRILKGYQVEAHTRDLKREVRNDVVKKQKKNLKITTDVKHTGRETKKGRGKKI